MKRQLQAIFATFALGLVFCASAAAAPSFTFTESKHQEATTHRGDEVVTYLVKVKNTGTTGTTGPINLTIGLPSGAELASGGEFGGSPIWVCHSVASACTASPASPLAPGAELPPLELQVWLYPDAPNTVTATFAAFGGGATGAAAAQDSFTFAPAKPFEILGFGAAACSEPPAALNESLCFDTFGSEEFTQAGAHPFAATSSLSVPTRRSAQKGVMENTSVEDLRDLYFELPAGFVGNPEATPLTCTVVQVRENKCSEAAVVGGVSIDIGASKDQERAIFRVFPEDGYPAAFAFRPVADSPITVVLRAKLRSNGDYGVTAVAPLPPQQPEFIRLKYATLCGYGASIEDQGFNGLAFKGCKKPGELTANETPFLTMPTQCGGAPDVTRAHIDSFQNPGPRNDEGFPVLSDPNWKSAEAVAPQNTGCAALTEAWAGGGPGSPSFGFKPDNTRAAAPVGYTAHLHIPQEGLLDKDGLATAHLKDTVVTLPEGVVLNPSAADGLEACTEAQAGYLGDGFGSPNPTRFSTTSPGCPESSKIGLVEVSTPILDETLEGAIYLAAQKDNPFGSDFATYLVIDDAKTGIKATLAGKVDPDPASGRITASFANNPQVPVEDLEVTFFGGDRASLVNPDVCGDYTTQTALTPWSAQDPDAPKASETAFSNDTAAIDTPASGQSSCPTSKSGRPFALDFSARSTNPIAGAYSPFVLRLTRGDGNQELNEISVATPPGFAAVLRGVQICPDAGLAQALSRTASGDGALEIDSPSCPAASQIGTTTIGAGSGPSPFYVKTGKVYLTGPYKSAPASLAFIVPAVAGPFDLGVQVVRTALYVNPKTAQVTAKSDPIPQILAGIPLQVRDVRVELDRPGGFTFNPTNCEAMAIAAQVTGGSGAVANLSNRFQVGGCENLGFEPQLKIRLSGGTKRSAYQRLEATVTARPGDANISRAAVTLPHAFFLAQEHIRTVCTRVQFAAKACPPGSVYGSAEATTPLLDGKLVGPVYLRSSDNPLPDLVAALRGPDAQPIEVELAGRTDSKDGGIRNTFDLVPDAPVSQFTLNLLGGKKSLIVNSRDLCKSKQRATVRLNGQNGMVRNFRPVIKTSCGKKKGKSQRRRSR